MLSQCYAQMKISFPGLIFVQYKSINIIIIITVNEPSGEREKLPIAQLSTFACSIVSTNAGKIFYHAVVGLLRHSLQSKQNSISFYMEPQTT